MPVYELSLVMRVLPRNELSAALKRIGLLLLEKGATVQKLDNLGTRELPYRFNAGDVSHYKGSYFIYSFLSSAKIFPDIIENCSRDVDILRHHLGDVAYKNLLPGCTLEEEMQPPALRQSVKDLMEKAKKKRKESRIYNRHVKEFSFYDPYM